MVQYIVTGMSCAACQARVEKAVAAVKGVKSVSVSLLTNTMGVEGDALPDDVIKAVEAAGYSAELKAGRKNDETGNNGIFEAEENALKDRETPVLVRRLVFSAVFLILLMYLTMGHNMAGWPIPDSLEGNFGGLCLTQAILAGMVMFVNRKFFTSGISALIHRSPNMDTLVALGSSVSFGWSLYVFYRITALLAVPVEVASWEMAENYRQIEDLYMNNLYFESAAMIPALITVGKMLESISKGRTTNALRSLMKLAPKTANLKVDDVVIEVLAENVKTGDIFVVKPGESIPVDGVVIDGFGSVNESALTGESIPVEKKEGSNVSAATINLSGYLTCRATRVGEDTTLAQIVQMVSDAAATKAPIAKTADRVSGIFVPVVMSIAVLVTIGWLIAGAGPAAALERGICVLVISCPCALGLATPVAIMVGNGLGARNGVLIKTGEVLENLGKTDIVALDKTGTITTGEPVVTDIVPTMGVDESELLSKAFSLEMKSEHPLSKAIVRKAEERGSSLSDVSDFRALPGMGVEAVLDGKKLKGGSISYMEGEVVIPEYIRKSAEQLAEQGKTPLLFSRAGKLLGMIAVADEPKKDSLKAIGQLRKLGYSVVMLTGDNRRTAGAIAEKVGVDLVIPDVYPGEKQEKIEWLKQYGKVIMVGDGINDAPALTAADIGIAIGAGTDVAIESAGIVLMSNSLTDVAAAVRLSRKTVKNIHENLFWAFFYNLICIPLAAGLFGLRMSPMIGAAAMSLSSVTVCLNALRLNLLDIHSEKHDKPGKTAAAIPDPGPSARETAVCPIENTTENEKEINNMKKTVKIEGMMCMHCEANVKKALEALDFVSGAEVSHEKGTAVITMNDGADMDAVKKAIEDKGYTYLGEEA